MATNPYNWQSHTPQVQIPRPDIGVVAKKLLANGSAVVLGGRGMGKSVFLAQLKARLEGEEDTLVLLVETPPPVLTAEACLGHLARRLEVPFGEGLGSREIFGAFFARADAPQHLVLLFDEFDRYAEKGKPSTQSPGRGFFNDLEASRRSLPQLGILAVGSIGVYIFRDVLGSSFLSRALHLRLRPFDRSEATRLAAPSTIVERRSTRTSRTLSCCRAAAFRHSSPMASRSCGTCRPVPPHATSPSSTRTSKLATRTICATC